MSLRDFLNALLPSSERTPPPPPVGSSPGPGGNPVQAWLDAVGLPWRTTQAELASRFGVHTDNPYQWELVPLDIQPPPLSHMLWPLGLQAFARNNPAVPPGYLSTHVWAGPDPEANIALAATEIGRYLGARLVTDRYNTRHVEWRWGAASVTLAVWPKSMQTGPRLSNPAHQRDPRLEAACSVSVYPGWRPPLAPGERAWLDTFQVLGPTRNWTPARPPSPFGTGIFMQTLVEFMREPPADLDTFRGEYGLSGDQQALIACDDNALYLLPLAQVTGFEVTRTLPAKGGGGSTLVAVCETGYAACPTKSVTLAQGAKADDLNEAAARLAAATSKPFKLGEYDYDA